MPADPHLRHSRISAGFCHNLVISGAREPYFSGGHDRGAQSGQDDSELDEVDVVWGFGSNRNHVLGMCLPEEKDELALDDQEKIEKYACVGNKCEVATKLRFKPKAIAAVCCGANHTVFLEKRPQQPEGKVWTMGLGTNGRLGVLRPGHPSNPDRTPLADFYDRSWEATVPVAIKCARKNVPVKTPNDLRNHVETNFRGEDFADCFKKCFPDATKYQNQLTSDSISKWSVREPVRVEFPCRDGITRICCGVDHTLAITSTGEVYAWGLGSFGNLGNGTTQDSLTPKKVEMPPQTPCIQVAAGTKHSMALTHSLHIYTWGHGGNGRLGQGEERARPGERSETYVSTLTPKEVVPAGGFPLKPMVWIAAGEAHSASIDNLGNVYCWGAGSWGRTGHGEEADTPNPLQLSSLSGIPCSQIACGIRHTIALTDKGTLYGWGAGPATGVLTPSHSEGQQKTPEKIRLTRNVDQGQGDIGDSAKDRMVEIAAGAFHSLALKYNGEVYVWGQDQDARLGLDTSRGESSSLYWPRVIKIKFRSKDAGTAEVGEWKVDMERFNFGQTDADGEDALAIADKGGQDGDADLDQDRLDIFCGGMSSAAIKGKNTLYFWGSNEYGQLGIGTNKDELLPKMVPLVDRKMRVRIVACGLEHTIMVLEATQLSEGIENVWSWGRNDHGQLGRTCTDSDTLVPQKVPDLRDAVNAGAGENHSAVVLSSGDVYTWGCAESGKLGIEGPTGPGSMNTLPQHVNLEVILKKVSCGSEHTAVIGKSGELYTFGAGWFGRLGHGHMSNIKRPEKPVQEFARYQGHDLKKIAAPRARDVYCASYHTCLVCTSSRLWICGRDKEVLSIDHVDTPTLCDRFYEENGSAAEIQDVAVCGQHTLVLSMKGSIWAWGDNSKGHLGIGPPDDSNEPAKLTPVTGKPELLKCKEWRNNPPRSIKTGVFHSLVKLQNGDVYAMGMKVGGRLGIDEEIRRREVPYPKKMFMAWNDDDPLRDAAEGQEDKPPALMNTPEQPAPLEDKKDDKAIDDDMGEKDGDPKFEQMQEKLKREREKDKENTKKMLKHREDEIQKKYQKYFQEILKLWDKPEKAPRKIDIIKLKPGDPLLSSEWTLRRLQDRLDRSVCRNIMKLQVAEEYPNLENGRVHSEVAQRLLFFEELLWLLQQQPCYLARLSRPAFFHPEVGFRRAYNQAEPQDEFPSGEESCQLRGDFFNKIITALFRPLSNDRIRHLYMALIRIVMKYEVNHYTKGRAVGMMHKGLFNPTESTTSLLICRFVKDPYFNKMHLAIVDDNEKSLIRLVELWTSDTKDKKKTKTPGGKQDEDSPDDVLFALELDDLDALKGAGGLAALSKKDSSMKDELRRQLQDHQRTFQAFLDAVHDPTRTGTHQKRNGGKAKESETEAIPETHSRATFRNFMASNIDNQSPFMEKDLKAIFVHIRNELDAVMAARRQREVPSDARGKANADDDSPLLRLFMSSVMAELLEHHETFMDPIRKGKMKERASIVLGVGSWVADKDKGAQKMQEESIDQLMKRVHGNVKQLGKFLKKAALDELDTLGPMIKEAGQRVKRFYLGNFLRDQLNGAEDRTETDLTIDLYTSHFDIEDKFVQINAIDLLDMSNAMWLFKDLIMLLDKPEEDRLYTVLDKIMPHPETKADDIAGYGASKRDKKARTRVYLIAETPADGNEHDGDVVLLHMHQGDQSKGYYAIPSKLCKLDTEDFAMEAVKNFEEVTGCMIMGSRSETRLLKQNTGEDAEQRPVREAVFGIRCNVSQPDAERMKYKKIDEKERVGGPGGPEEMRGVVLKNCGKKDWLLSGNFKTYSSAEVEYQALLQWTLRSDRRGAGWDMLPNHKLERDISEVEKRFWPEWTESKSVLCLKVLRADTSQHNFRINHRFLESQRDLCFCRDCEAPIPRSIAPQHQRGRSDTRLIKVFRPKEGEKIEGRYPFADLEEFLARHDLDLIKKNEYMQANYELDEIAKKLTQLAVNKDRTQTDYSLPELIEKAKKDMDLLRIHGYSEDRLLEFVTDAIKSRQQHGKYLKTIESSVEEIQKASREHAKKVSRLVTQLAFAVQASEQATIPEIFKTQAAQTGLDLSMTFIQNQMLKHARNHSGEEEPLLYASGTYSLGTLRSKKVVARVGGKIQKSEYRNLYFSFNADESGAWKVRVLHKADGSEHLLMSFDIPVLMLEDMKRTGKTEKKPMGDGDMFIFNCFSLVQLLARISANSGS